MARRGDPSRERRRAAQPQVPEREAWPRWQQRSPAAAGAWLKYFCTRKARADRWSAVKYGVLFIGSLV